MKIKDIGEFELINRITKKFKKNNIFVGIGDDAAVIKTKGLQVLTTDCLIEGDHFRKGWFTPKQIGMKSIEINVSDVASMGGIPKYALISLCLPDSLDVSFVESLYAGFWKSCNSYDVDIIGGNMAHSNQIMISVFLLGEVDKKNLSLRSDAKPGDYLMVSGYLGNGRAGLRLFQENINAYKKVKNSYLEPKSKLVFSKKIASYVNSMIDISDGLAPETGHICDESNCGALIYKEKIPINDEVRAVAKTLSESEYDYALYGGEDFELLYSVSKENIDKVGGFIVGEITKNEGIFFLSNNKKERIKKGGYDHFSQNIL